MRTLNIEIVLNTHSLISHKAVISIVQNFIQNVNVKSNTVITQFDNNLHPILNSAVKAIIIEEIDDFSEGFLDLSQFQIAWYVYSLDQQGPIYQIEEEEEDQINFSTHLVLPSIDLHNLWENLYYDNNIKSNLLNYVQTMMEFADKGVDFNMINCNRVLLLHGPPGTGKTSLCKALAHKLTIRMKKRFNSGILIEINSHSLFSKWFSESGKLVTKMFAKIREIVENSSLLVCVLIDEIESLAHARNQCLSGNDPSDSIRVVNAVLTQLDQIKRHSNVLILTTSNITESIDLAFVDRADIKQFLGLPSTRAIYKVYQSCLQELIKAQIINDSMDKISFGDGNEKNEKLWKICEISCGLSGRSLRKIPFLAHALFLNSSFVTLEQFFDAMESAIHSEKKEKEYFKN